MRITDFDENWTIECASAITKVPQGKNFDFGNYRFFGIVKFFVQSKAVHLKVDIFSVKYTSIGFLVWGIDWHAQIFE